MTISSVASVASTLISSSGSTDSSTSSADLEKQKQAIQQEITQENQNKDDAAAKAQKLQDYNQELKKVEAELQQLYQSSTATAGTPTKPKGPTSGLVDESA